MTVPWRERPPDLTASAIMPAATAEVAHATLAGCHRLRCRLRTAGLHGQILMAFGGGPARFPEPFPPWFSDSGSETADAARGAATKSGGWRNSGTLRCQPKQMMDEPVSARAFSRKFLHTDDLQAERESNKRGVLCRARNTLSRRH